MDKLTKVEAGYTAGYYVNGKFYAEIHENDFTSEVEDVYRNLLLKYNVVEIEDTELSDDQFEVFDALGGEFPNKLSDLFTVINETEESE